MPWCMDTKHRIEMKIKFLFGLHLRIKSQKPRATLLKCPICEGEDAERILPSKNPHEFCSSETRSRSALRVELEVRTGQAVLLRIFQHHYLLLLSSFCIFAFAVAFVVSVSVCSFGFGNLYTARATSGFLSGYARTFISFQNSEPHSSPSSQPKDNKTQEFLNYTCSYQAHQTILQESSCFL